jgi:L-asparagine transporter-like permease
LAEPRKVRKGASDISETPSPEHLHQQQLVRTLGLIDVVMIGIAGMIGGAIFVLVGPAIGLAGSAVIIAFIIDGIITLFTAAITRLFTSHLDLISWVVLQFIHSTMEKLA